jgi:hypothetical protein
MSIKSIALCVAYVLAISGPLASAVADQDRDHHEADHRENNFSIALWGDMPYAKNGDNDKIAALIADINAARVKFSIFSGDIKDGSSACEDSQYTSAIERFNSFRSPMIYVPGDNEWTDCHRTNNGGYNNLERLDFIRATLFGTAYSFGQHPMKLEHQGTPAEMYAENTRWTYGKVVFVGLNIPGSNNNKVNSDAECIKKSARTLEDCADDNAEYLARDAANISFVKASFQKAKDQHAAGIMIVIQADPGFDLPETEDVNERIQPGVDGYDNFMATLVEETNNFNGQVVLVHGDTHFYKVDKPLVNQANLVKNFTRLETFGSPNIHWVKVTVDIHSPNVFSFEPVIVPGN